MASILYVDRLSPAASKTMGQAINNAVTYGFGLMVGFFLSGSLYKSAGAAPLFLASAGIALTGGLVFGIMNLRKKAMSLT
jgi:PPP family 3-phenylpropionic acid transporter